VEKWLQIFNLRNDLEDQIQGHWFSNTSQNMVQAMPVAILKKKYSVLQKLAASPKITEMKSLNKFENPRSRSPKS